ncbi:MAG: hypothetical protein F6J98_23845 [Moorea sp. SIO4G2]|nr:hypothetical protein [Moorena sp. SIO4G2]
MRSRSVGFAETLHRITTRSGALRNPAGCPKAGEEAENEAKPAPNAPYWTVACSRFPIPDSRFPILLHCRHL